MELTLKFQMSLSFNGHVNSFPKQYNNILVKTLTNRKNLFSLEEQKFRLINEELQIKLNGDENEQDMCLSRKKLCFHLMFPG
jgi:hypothetical protein